MGAVHTSRQNTPNLKTIFKETVRITGKTKKLSQVEVKDLTLHPGLDFGHSIRTMEENSIVNIHSLTVVMFSLVVMAVRKDVTRMILFAVVFRDKVLVSVQAGLKSSCLHSQGCGHMPPYLAFSLFFK